MTCRTTKTYSMRTCTQMLWQIGIQLANNFYEYSYNRQVISDNLEQGKNYFVFPWPVGSLKTLKAGHVDIKVGNGQKQRILLLLVDPIELLRTT